MNASYELSALSGKVYIPDFIRKLNCENALEEKFIKQILKSANKENTKIYLLENDKLCVGFIALSVSHIESYPVVLIDYLYIQTLFRKQKISALGDIKASEYLVKFAINRALEVKKIVGVRFLLLQAAHNKLIEFYKKCGFGMMPDTKDAWMIMPLSHDK